MDIFNEIINFKNSKEWLDFMEYYGANNVARQIGLFRYEDVHTNFLSSLLRSDNVYGYGTLPIKFFIELIKCKNSDKYFNDFDIFSNYDILNVKVISHESLSKDSGIPDLVIEFDVSTSENIFKYVVLIEAKYISSYEGEYQCQKYYEALEKKDEYKDREKIYLFLSLEDNPILSFNKDIDINDIYTKISYQDLVDYLYNPCILSSNRNIAFSVREYVKCFNELYDWNISNDMIPLTLDGKNLTLDLWNKHCNFFEFLFSNVNNNYVNSFYTNNSKLFRIFFINLNKLTLLINISNDVKNKINLIANNIKKHYVYIKDGISNYCSSKDFVLNLIVDIKNNYSEKLWKAINEKTFKNYHLLISDEEYNNKVLSKSKGYSYYWEDVINNSNSGLNVTSDYHMIYLNSNDIDILIDTVIKIIPEYKDKIFRVSNDIRELIKSHE